MAIRLLIVDDSKLARATLARAVRALQPTWTLLEATNAEDAMALLARSGADIVLLDYALPGHDGLTLASDLRKIHPDVPLALISATTQDRFIAGARAIGVPLLPKPCSERLLAEFLLPARERLESKARDRQPG